MLSLGLVAGALTAHLGLKLEYQMISAGVVACGFIISLYWYQIRKKSNQDTTSQSMDIGGVVVINFWNNDHTSLVNYRGSSWTAKLKDGEPTALGPHIIVDIEGSQLVVRKL
tara:strand:+ start:48 stop:383 length:336 start_codon:yes stop_codon:yes gene_type:complete